MSKCNFSWNPTEIFARIRPNGEPIKIDSPSRYMVSLKLKETELVANSISSTKTLSGKEGTDVNELRYGKSTQIEITTSKGTLVNSIYIYIYIYIRR